MPDRTWKKAERRVAARFGSVRAPLSGGNGRLTRSDTLHPRLFIETKYRQRFAVVDLYRETEALARLEGKFPVVALVGRGERQVFGVVPLDRDYLLKLAEELTAVIDESSMTDAIAGNTGPSEGERRDHVPGNP